MSPGELSPGEPSPGQPSTTVLDCSGVGPGGITRVLSELVRHWPAGERVEVVAAPPGWRAPDGTVAELTVHSVQSGGRARAIGSAFATLRRVTAGRPAGTGVLSLSPSIAMAGSRLPVTTLVHDLAFRLWPRDVPPGPRRYRRISYATAVRRSARLLAVSARTRHDLAGLYGVPEDRVDVWHPGSDLAAVPGELPAPLAGLALPYLAVAGHAPHKGVELAIEALAEEPGYALAVLTGGQRVPRFAEAAAASPAAGRVLFLDRLDDGRYAATLAGAAAFLMPSHFEGYGLPAVEALALGTPVVVSPDPALHEATHGRAVRMDSWTAAALRHALARIGPPGRVGVAPRGWREATAELVALLRTAPVAVPGRR